jgi:hypothetical protein
MPRTEPYRRVVALLGDSAGGGGAAGVTPGTLAEVADATLDASLDGLELAKGDEGLAHCVYLLVRVTRAAREADFLVALDRAGVPTPAGISGLPDVPIPGGADDYRLFDLTCGFTAAVDRHLRDTRARTDVGELAQLAAAESLSALCWGEDEVLFDLKRGGTGGDAPAVQEPLRNLSTRNGFARLAHDFFARLIRRYLEYHLSRELPNHVGPNRRFRDVDEHNDFLRALDEHCRRSTRVMREFAGDWYSLHNFKGDVSVAKARGFAAHALDKVRDALAYQEGWDVPGVDGGNDDGDGGDDDVR